MLHFLHGCWWKDIATLISAGTGKLSRAASFDAEWLSAPWDGGVNKPRETRACSSSLADGGIKSSHIFSSSPDTDSHQLFIYVYIGVGVGGIY